MPAWLRAKMRLLRPVMHDDADALLLVRLCMEAASGLAYIHECGLIHRDIKASNVLLTTVDGVRHAKVSDLGGATTHAVMPADASNDLSDPCGQPSKALAGGTSA